MDNPVPCYDGANLANLASELETRLNGRSPTRGLRPGLAELIPHTRNYLLLIIDGLGDQQLTYPAAATLRRHRRAALSAPFPTTTTVGLSSVATALAPIQHGVIGYTQWMPTLRTVVNMQAWVDIPEGQPIDLDPAGFHPSSNLCERVGAAGVRTVIFQPSELLDTPLSNMVCRGAERHGYSSPFDIRPSAPFDAGNRTLAVVYTTPVDTAAHASGQRSQAYSTALSQTGQAWEHFRRSLPRDTTLIGSADHGHCDIPPMGRSTWTRTSPTACNAGETAAYSCSPDPSNAYTGSLSGPARSSSAPNNYTNGWAEDPHTRPSVSSQPRRS